MTDCPTDEDLFAYVDRQPVSDEVRRHFQVCPRCRQWLDELARLQEAPFEVDTERGTSRVLERLRAPRRSRWWVVAAAAALLGLVPAAWYGTGVHDRFTPRGGGASTSASWLKRQVGVELHRLDAPEAPFPTGASVVASARWLAVVRNADLQRDGYALVFAVDAAGEIHWLYPAHLSDTADEPSLRIPAATAQRAASEAVELEGAVDGPATFFVVVTAEPRRVSEVEGLGRITLEHLEARFEGAWVWEGRTVLTR